MYLLHLLLVFIASPHFSQNIRKVPIYPAGISVSWKALPPEFQEEQAEDAKKLAKKKKKRLSRKAQKELEEELAKLAAETKNELVKVNRLVRVVSSITLKADEQFFLAFYDAKKNPLPKHSIPITNVAKPSPANVFFMDKAVYRNFKGMADVYFFPPNAAYMNVIIGNKKGEKISAPKNPTYDANGLISIPEFQALELGKRLMFQFEAQGTSDKTVLRMAIFRFR